MIDKIKFGFYVEVKWKSRNGRPCRAAFHFRNQRINHFKNKS